MWAGRRLRHRPLPRHHRQHRDQEPANGNQPNRGFLTEAPVVICPELPNDAVGSITNSAETIAAGVIRANELPTPLV